MLVLPAAASGWTPEGSRKHEFSEAPKLAAVLKGIADAGLAARDRKALMRQAVEMELGHEQKLQQHEGGVLQRYEDLIGTAADLMGKSKRDIPAASLRAHLITMGQRALARRVERLAKARPVVAHPDVTLIEDVHAAFSWQVITSPHASTYLGSDRTSNLDSSADEASYLESPAPAAMFELFEKDDVVEVGATTSEMGKVEAADEWVSGGKTVPAVQQLGEDDNASPEAFFFGDPSVNVATQTTLSLPGVDLMCSCAVSPQEALELAWEWIANDKLHEIRKCAERVEVILGPDIYVDEHIGTPQRRSWDIVPLDADSVALDCAMLRAALDRFAACAHPADNSVKSSTVGASLQWLPGGGDELAEGSLAFVAGDKLRGCFKDGRDFVATVHELCPQYNEAYVKVDGSKSQFAFIMTGGAILDGRGVPMRRVEEDGACTLTKSSSASSRRYTRSAI